MCLFSRSKCNHDYRVYQRSNALQQDNMGYPLRLCIVKCTKCGDSSQQWIDEPVEVLKELETGQSVLIKWQ